MMDQRELAQRIKALQSSLTKNEPASEIMAQMELIKKDSSPTEEMLRVSYPPFVSIAIYSIMVSSKPLSRLLLGLRDVNAGAG